MASLFPSAPDTVLFGRYRVKGELGRGGMGIVLLARDEELGQAVAIKILPPIVVQDPDAIGELKREVLRGMGLMHPGIVRTHTFERDEIAAGIVMEYVDGENLGARKAEQPGKCFEWEALVPWIEQLCAALDYAHSVAFIAHRDLKPRNLLLTREGKVKIADFGIASSLSDTIGRTSVRTDGSGTPSYMSPQQAMGAPPSHLDDIYGLGATIYELLTGKPPFFRGEILAQVLNVIAPSMEERRAELCVTDKAPIPRAWEETISACLAKEPRDRPQSAGDVMRRLLPLAEGSRARPPRRAIRWTAAAVGLTGLIVTGVFAKRRQTHDSGAPPRSEQAAAGKQAAREFFSDPSDVRIDDASGLTQPQPLSLKKADFPQDRFHEIILQGRASREAGDVNRALTRFREASALEPANPEAIAEIAVSYEKMSLSDKAAEEWRRIYNMGDSAGLYFIAAEGRLKLSSAQVAAAMKGAAKPLPSPQEFAQAATLQRDAALLPFAPRARKPGNTILAGDSFASRPPFGLKWGEDATRIEGLLKNTKATIAEKRLTAGGEAWTVEGIVLRGLHHSTFYFVGGRLAEVELNYQREDWDTLKYDNFMGSVRSAIDKKYGAGELVRRRSEPVGDTMQTMVVYQWTPPQCVIFLSYFAAEQGDRIFRTISVHYQTVE